MTNEIPEIQLVILDLHLKEGTGFGILRAISTFPDKPRVVVLTNHDSADNQGNAITLGAAVFLDKARDFARLPHLLAELGREIQSMPMGA
jgi:DNA-binding response OmpR family regulator